MSIAWAHKLYLSNAGFREFTTARRLPVAACSVEKLQSTSTRFFEASAAYPTVHRADLRRRHARDGHGCAELVLRRAMDSLTQPGHATGLRRTRLAAALDRSGLRTGRGQVASRPVLPPTGAAPRLPAPTPAAPRQTVLPGSCRCTVKIRTFAGGALPERGSSGHSGSARARGREREWRGNRLSRRAHRRERCS